jgi:hypothetical protein
MMNKYICPHCHHESISSKQKLFLGAANPIACGNCGATLKGSRLWNALACLPYLGLCFLYQFDPEILPALAIVLMAVTVSMIVHMAGPLKLDTMPTSQHN